jgi:hypothetical protein
MEVNELGRHYIAIFAAADDHDGRYERRDRWVAPFSY